LYLRLAILMNILPYIKFNVEQLDKIGNTVIYLADRIPQLSKTKLLKLLYILDEISIKKSGIPILNLKYKVWKFGPVSEELFIELSSDSSLLEKFINRDNEGNHIVSKVKFNDDEFSENDIDLLNYVIEKYGNKTAKELVSYTHRVNSPWYITAKQNSVLELLENESINNTEYLIDMGMIVSHDERKLEIYSEYIES
jgi:uncharacterized phage-associated protein